MIDKSSKNFQPNFLERNKISPTKTFKNLGVTFDSGNTFTNHITKVCRACYYHLKDLRCICKFLSLEIAALLANSMISSRLDYCNFLLYDISKNNVAKLQKIQNALSKVVFRLNRTSHVSLFLQKLHWLCITYRILFKYNLITFKAIKFSQSTYLSSLIKSSRLTHGNQLSLSSVHPRKAIDRQGFAMASPTEWNRLPQSVRSQHTITGFRSQLKTYLFRLAYPPPKYISLVGANLDLNLICAWTFPFSITSALEDAVSILHYVNVSILFYCSGLKSILHYRSSTDLYKQTYVCPHAQA